MTTLQHPNPFKPLLLAGVALLLIAVAFDPMLRGLLTPDWASAVGGYSASDALGQIDAADTAYYTSAGGDNAPNARGLDIPFSAVTDLVGHRLFVSDFNNNRVLVFNLDSSSNEIVDRVADHVLGQSNFKTNTSGTTQNTLSGPAGLVYDATGSRLFVGDTSNNRVMVFDVAVIIDGENAMNVLGQPDFVTPTPGTTQRKLYNPFDLIYDESGNRLFVSDYTVNRVMVFDASVANLASDGNGTDALYVIGQTNFTDVTSATTQRKLYNPLGLVYDTATNRLFVADNGNNRVMVFDASNANLASDSAGPNGMTDAINVLGQAIFTDATPGLTQSKMLNPYGLAYDASGDRLFVNDQSQNRILVFDVATILDGENATNVIGQTDFVTGTPGLTPKQFGAPLDLAYSTSGDRLFVGDQSNSRMLVFDASLANLASEAVGLGVATNAVNALGQLDGVDAPLYTVNGVNNTPNAQGFSGPTHTAIDTTNHRLFVSDSGNNRVLVYSLDASDALIDHTADFVLGQPDFKTNTAATTQSGLSGPKGLAYDSTGNRLFVADYTNNRVMVFDVATIINGENAVNELGQVAEGACPGIGSFTMATALTLACTLSSPFGLAYDATGNRLFVADQNNYRVMVFDVAIITDGMDASYVLGQTDFTTGTAGTTQSKFDSALGLAYDATGDRLFVADYSNSRVMVFDVRTAGSVPRLLCGDTEIGIANSMNASCVLGQTDFTTATAGATQSKLNWPYSLAYDATGNRLFVADYSNNRVMVFDVAVITNGEDATDVYGQTDFTTATAGTTQSTMNSPEGVGWVGSQLYVADASNNRIMIFGGAAPTPTPTPTPVGGSKPVEVEFYPERIVINSDESSTDSKNVLVNIYAHHGNNFTGTVDVLLSNSPDFSTTIPFRYIVGYPYPDIWPKTVSWDLCFGMPAQAGFPAGTLCDVGQKNVYARFYVNTIPPQPAWTPLPANN